MLLFNDYNKIHTSKKYYFFEIILKRRLLKLYNLGVFLKTWKKYIIIFIYNDVEIEFYYGEEVVRDFKRGIKKSR